MYGANADQLEALAQQFGAAARMLDNASRQLSAQLNSTPWRGARADRFRADWNRRHRRDLAAARQFLLGAQNDLRRNASQQRDASGAVGGALVAPGAPAGVSTGGSSGRITDQREAIRLAQQTARTAQNAMPGAADRLAAWAAELEQRPATPAELQAFLKYRELVRVAMSMRASVGSAAEFGIQQGNAAAGGVVEVGVSVGTAGAGLLADGLPKGALAERTLGEIKGTVIESSVMKGAELAGIGVETGDPTMIRKAYEARADAFLLCAEAQLRTSQNDRVMNLDFIADNAIDEYGRRVEVAVANGAVADAFDLGPMSTAMSTGMNSLVPMSGTATFAVLGSAESAARFASSAEFLNVATDASLDQLQRTYEAMKP